MTAEFEPLGASGSIPYLENSSVEKPWVVATLYAALVSPHLEHDVWVWHLSLLKDKTVLQKVYRQSTKISHELRGQTNTEGILVIFQLEYTRLREGTTQILEPWNGSQTWESWGNALEHRWSFWRTLTKFQKKAQKGGSIPREKLNQKFDIPVLLRKALLHTIARPKFGRIDGFSVDVGPCVS